MSRSGSSGCTDADPLWFSLQLFAVHSSNQKNQEKGSEKCFCCDEKQNDFLSKNIPLSSFGILYNPLKHFLIAGFRKDENNAVYFLLNSYVQEK